MDWWEISVTLSSDLAEAVSEIFLLYVPQGVVVDFGDRELGTSATVRAYLLVDEETASYKRELLTALRRFSQVYSIPAPVVTVIQDQDWTADWRETIPILHLGQRIVIKPSWRSYRSVADEIVLEVDPGAAFGTGTHPTTQLCIEVLERRLKPDMRVLDLGTGTGILALVAAKLGAADVLALDCDPNAITVARRNAEINHVAHVVHAGLGSLPEVQGTYDIVLVNILASTIIQMLGSGLIDHICPQGICVASGILTEQSEAVSAAMNAQGMRVVALCEREGWATLVAAT
jgi:ribosomal protein L11 methyltransferase